MHLLHIGGLELAIPNQRRMQPLTRLLSTDLEFINGDESESSDGEQFLQQLQLDKRKTKIRSRVNEQVKPMGKC